MSPADQVIFGILNAVLLIVIGYWLVGFDREFGSGFAAEDGPVEYGTAVLLLLAAFVLLLNAGRLFRKGCFPSGALVFVYFLAFIFGAGEEVSWGQRIFGIETPEYFKENNAQGELTLHNLNWGEDHIAHTIFGNLLSLVILSYLVILPLLYPRVKLVRALADRLIVPVPSRRHMVGAIAGRVANAVEIPWRRSPGM